ncbi:MAG: type II toxin-antitoxin system RelE/ParE family toxin [Algoriphagus aquaeductus]|uniref:type II toxin-antitoxin system RelE/ParE family toxin n=1 Tax=Algoriphagus aquaeductus TaxID=475299 RepID=UPI003919FE79
MEVFVTPRAEKNFDSIVEYIKKNWGDNSAKEFIHKADAIFKILKAQPLIGKVEIDDIRGFQLSPQTRILYRIRGNKIIILSFFDVRKNPKKKFK